MSLFKRVKNIIKSNINHTKEEIEVDINSFEDLYFEDSKETEKFENEIEKKYYKILEIDYGADFSEIKRAYRKLLKKYHPDMFQNNPKKLEIAQKVTKQINEAYMYFERKFL